MDDNGCIILIHIVVIVKHSLQRIDCILSTLDILTLYGDGALENEFCHSRYFLFAHTPANAHASFIRSASSSS